MLIDPDEIRTLKQDHDAITEVMKRLLLSDYPSKHSNWKLLFCAAFHRRYYVRTGKFTEYKTKTVWESYCPRCKSPCLWGEWVKKPLWMWNR